jgi:Na+/melibiose symporter-like transporter
VSACGGGGARHSAVLTIIGYDGLAKAQTPATIGGIETFLKNVPIGLYIIFIIILLAYKLYK